MNTPLIKLRVACVCTLVIKEFIKAYTSALFWSWYDLNMCFTHIYTQDSVILSYLDSFLVARSCSLVYILYTCLYTYLLAVLLSHVTHVLRTGFHTRDFITPLNCYWPCQLAIGCTVFVLWNRSRNRIGDEVFMQFVLLTPVWMNTRDEVFTPCANHSSMNRRFCLLTFVVYVPENFVSPQWVEARHHRVWLSPYTKAHSS